MEFPGASFAPLASVRLPMTAPLPLRVWPLASVKAVAAEPAIEPDAAAHGHGTVRQRAVHHERAFRDKRRAGLSFRAIQSQPARARLRQFHRAGEFAGAAIERVILWRVNHH